MIEDPLGADGSAGTAANNAFGGAGASGAVALPAGPSKAKAPPTAKWTAEETERFYEAVRAFGFDLVLVGSVFPLRTAAMIKRKYTQEMKKNADKMDRAFEAKKPGEIGDHKTRDQGRICPREFFEKKTGVKIDESKHWRPSLEDVQTQEAYIEAVENGEEVGNGTGVEPGMTQNMQESDAWGGAAWDGGEPSALAGGTGGDMFDDMFAGM